MTIAHIFDGKSLTRFTHMGQGEMVYKKMKEDGKKVIFSRGVIIEYHKDKTMEEIKDMMKIDIENSLKASNELNDKMNIEITDYKEEIKV